MEYQNVDEAARIEACKRVKQLAEAIKRIRKKYYLYFNKISDSDKQKYSHLVSELQAVASENGLQKLSVQLMADINIQYGTEIGQNDGNGGSINHFLEELYKKFIAGSKLQAEFTNLFKQTGESAYLKRAIQVQEHLKKIARALEQIDGNLHLGLEKARIMRDTFKGKEQDDDILSLCKKSYGETRGTNVFGDLLELLGLHPYSGEKGIKTFDKKPELLGRY